MMTGKGFPPPPAGERTEHKPEVQRPLGVMTGNGFPASGGERTEHKPEIKPTVVKINRRIFLWKRM